MTNASGQTVGLADLGGRTLYGCELMYGPEDAAMIQREVRRASGGKCPCEQGVRCPLLPADLTPLLQVRLPIRPPELQISA